MNKKVSIEMLEDSACMKAEAMTFTTSYSFELKGNSREREINAGV